MTVLELIEKLRELPSDLPIGTWFDGKPFFIDGVRVDVLDMGDGKGERPVVFID